jgi:FkbM family methyltransferase
VWVRNGRSVFKQYGDDGTSQGSLLEETNGDKEYHDYHSSIEVDTIDFYEFVKTFKPHQEIYIKMDIEWSEYQVIEDMLFRGWPQNIKHIWIEWHGINHKLYRNKANFLMNEIRSEGCEVTEWH